MFQPSETELHLETETRDKIEGGEEANVVKMG
jgi:hypothetical protein